jgi:hypothetical protein
MAADWGESGVALKADPSRDKGRASLASPPTPRMGLGPAGSGKPSLDRRPRRRRLRQPPCSGKRRLERQPPEAQLRPRRQAAGDPSGSRRAQRKFPRAPPLDLGPPRSWAEPRFRPFAGLRGSACSPHGAMASGPIFQKARGPKPAMCSGCSRKHRFEASSLQNRL